jgi:hypothetical protein
MKPTLTSFFSGASEPAAHAVCRTPGGTSAINDAYPAAAPALRRNLRRAGRGADISFLCDINDSLKTDNKKTALRALETSTHERRRSLPQTLVGLIRRTPTQTLCHFDLSR